MNECGIYVHFPFCLSKCHYCDFNSFPVSENPECRPQYLEALKKEIALFPSSKMKNLNIISIYFGGGTPTLFEPQTLKEILGLIKGRFYLKKGLEITIETNPKILSLKDLGFLKRSGFNRLSVGIQSFHDRLLKRLGRIHTGKEGVSAIQNAKDAGFKNISIDLMFGIPGQTLSDWSEDIEQALVFSLQHIAAYNLTVEKETLFDKELKKGALKLPSEEIELKMYEKTLNVFQDNGYEHYEISNFAKKGFCSAHNQIYWRNEDYIGFGAGAYSYMDGTRYHTDFYPKDYIRAIMQKGQSRAGEEKLEKEQQMGETIVMGLRLTKGIELERFNKRYGVDLRERYSCQLENLLSHKLIVLDNGYLRLSHKGLLFSNRVMMEFLSTYEN
jgi:oxygen-independent coproporphyrinogen III oxidase